MTVEEAVNAVLADGHLVQVRALHPGDVEAVLALHACLRERDSYLRFFGTPRDLRGLAARIAADPGPQHGAVGAFQSGSLIGVAHYEGTADSVADGEAEVAMAVAATAQSHGVGTLLLEHLATLAHERGITRFSGVVLGENGRMLRVLADLGLPVDVASAGPEREFVLSLDLDADRYRVAVADREREADIASLRPVLAPASIVVIGAGRRPESVGRAVLANLTAGGYPGPLAAVNPHADRIAGVRCVSTVAALAFRPDLAVICVPAAAVPDAVADCGRAGVPAAVIVTAGLTGTALADRVRALAGEHGVRLVGPNCLGMVNTDPAVRMNATFMSTAPLAGPVGVVTQSGGVGIALAKSLRALDIGISTLVSTGDKYDISGNDLLRWWQRDPATRVAVLYLESFGNPRKFSRLARELSAGTPVLAVRGGTSTAAQRAAASHTAATVTPVVTRDALYDQAGIIAVDGLTELVDIIAVLSWQPLPAGPRVAVITNAGGLGVLAADACADRGLDVRAFDEPTVAALRDLLPDQAALTNPVDTTATVSAATFAACVQRVLADEQVDAVLAVVVPTALGDPAAALGGVLDGQQKPVLLVRPGQLARIEPLADHRTRVTAAFGDAADAAAVLDRLVRYGRWRARAGEAVPALAGIDEKRATELIRGRDGWLDPATVTNLLACFGIPVLDARLACDEGAAVAAVSAADGPVVLKVNATGVLHKTHANGVRLGVSDPAEAAETFRLWQHRFGPAFGGMLVQPVYPVDRELLVGVHSDPVFGPLVVFGLGGTDTDLVDDRAARLAPLTASDADLLVHGLRSSATLFGSGELDPEPVRDLLVRVGRLAIAVPQVAELDLNPVAVHEHTAMVLDARIRVRPPAPGDPFLRRLG